MSESGISCIIPVYNGERYLTEAVKNIFDQTHPPDELIIVDDGSTDGTPEVIASFGDEVRSVRQLNGGAASARNHGVSLARGDYVAFLDADDLWDPHKLEIQTRRFDDRPELGMTFGHRRNFWIPELLDEAERVRDTRLTDLAPCYTTVTMLARRSVFDDVGGFDETLSQAEDLDWTLRARDLGKVMEMLPDVLLFRRMHYANISRIPEAQYVDSIARVVKASLDRRRAGAARAPAPGDP